MSAVAALCGAVPTEVVTNSLTFQRLLQSMPSGVAWFFAGFFLALWLFYPWGEKSRVMAIWEWLFKKFDVEFAKAGQWGHGLDTDLQVKAKIRFRKTGPMRLRLRVFEMVGQGRPPWQTVYDLGAIAAVRGDTRIIEVVDCAFPFPGWDHEKPRGWSENRERPLIGNSRNIAIIECSGRFHTQKFHLYIQHINHDTGVGKFKPSLCVIREDDEIWDVSEMNKIGEWK